MKNRLVRTAVLLAGSAAIIGTWSSSPVSGQTSKTAVKAAVPSVPSDIIKAARKFKGRTINFYGLSAGTEPATATKLAKKFTQQTGITVKVTQMPANASNQYAQVSRLLASGSSSVDVVDLDVIWQGAFAQYMVDLKPALGKYTKGMFPFMVKNDTVNGKLVAMPWIENHPVLYYRKDLLTKYGISGPPKTWSALQADAKKVIAGEKAKNPNFTGFVFQGNAYEGLTCDAMEWLVSSGAGQVISGKKITINNPKAVAMLNRVRGWVGTISPKGVTTYAEADSLNAFTSGDALFLRNWLYAYTVSSGSKIRGKFGVAPLPSQGGPHAATFGGATLGVSKFSKSPGAAMLFVRYLVTPATETYWTLQTSDPPSIAAVAKNPSVLKVVPPLRVKEHEVARPSTFFGAHYNQASTIMYQGINRILAGSDASSVLPGIQSQLQHLAP